MTQHNLTAPHIKRKIYERQNGKCIYCGEHRNISYMTVDHIIPLSRDGADDIGNMRCACKKCNGFKGNMLPIEFSERLHQIFMSNLKFCEMEVCSEERRCNA